MKRLLLLAALLLCSSSLLFLHAQSPTSWVIKPYKFYISKPLRDLPVDKNPRETSKLKQMEKQREGVYHYNNAPAPGPFEADPIIQRTAGGPVLDTPLVNFDASPLYNSFCPTDPDGAAGPNYYVEVDNCDMAVYTKSGGVVMAPRQIGWIWDSSNLGDPVVLYDKFADRWFVSQLRYDWVTLDVAVSVTNDPTGAYYVWYYNMGYLPDYPKYSVWPDGYYMTFRGLGSNPELVTVLQRNRMLLGSPSAVLISDTIPYFRQMEGNNRIPDSPKPLDCDGTLPPSGTPNFLFFFQNVASGGPADRIMIYKLKTDTAAKTIAITRYDSLTVAPFDAFFCGVCGSISQPGYPHSLDVLDGEFGFRAPFMRFTGYSSVVLSNTVNTGNYVAGLRWYELRLNDTTLKWSIHQQGTYAPADGASRWNSSICMNYNGDIAMAYTVSDSMAVYPSIRYTGRLSTDPLGQMTFAEQTAIKGTSAQSYSFRWGDYSCSNVDPADGNTFWHTNCYVAGADTQHTRVFCFRLESPNGIGSIAQTPKAALDVFQNGSILKITASQIPGSGPVNIALFDMTGKQLSSEWLSPQGGVLQTQINVGSLPMAAYLVRAGNLSFQMVQKVLIK